MQWENVYVRPTLRPTTTTTASRAALRRGCASMSAEDVSARWKEVLSSMSAATAPAIWSMDIVWTRKATASERRSPTANPTTTVLTINTATWRRKLATIHALPSVVGCTPSATPPTTKPSASALVDTLEKRTNIAVSATGWGFGRLKTPSFARRRQCFPNRLPQT